MRSSRRLFKAGGLGALLCLAMALPAAAGAAEVVRRFVEDGLNAEDLAALAEFVTADFVFRQYGEAGGGLETLEALVTARRSTWPGRSYSVEEIVTEGDRVMALVTLAGPVEGGAEGEPLVLFFRLDGERIAESWSLLGPPGSARGPEAMPPVAETAAPPTPPIVSEPEPSATPSGALSGVVLVAGKGEPREFFMEAVEELSAALRSSGVRIEEATHGVGYLQDARAAIPQFLEQVRASGAEGLLFVSAKFGARERIQVECLDGSGGQLWKDRVQGGLGLTKVEMNAKLLARMVKKLDKRLGGPCLPVG